MSIIKSTVINTDNCNKFIKSARIDEHDDVYWICVTITADHPMLQLEKIDSQNYHLYDESWNGDSSMYMGFNVPGYEYAGQLNSEHYEYNEDGSVGIRYYAYHNHEEPKNYIHACECMHALTKDLNCVKWIKKIIKSEIKIHKKRLRSYKELLTTSLEV